MPAVRLLFWAQAKHRAGLERPHFLGFQPPKKDFGVAPAQLSFLVDEVVFARA